MAKNVLGEPLESCSTDPMTGWHRDGCCSSGSGDVGLHLVCSVMTQTFLMYSRSRGNDLITPQPAMQFPGLKPGDRWCVCASRWVEAYESGVAPPVVLEATHMSALEYIDLAVLKEHEFLAGGEE